MKFKLDLLVSPKHNENKRPDADFREGQKRSRDGDDQKREWKREANDGGVIISELDLLAQLVGFGVDCAWK